jgi:hypothetical protein
MDIPRHLIRQLAALTETIDEPGADLQAMLQVLIDDLTLAVPSLLGLTLTVTRGGVPVTLQILPPEHADAVSTSLLIPLDMIGVDDPGGTLIIFAARPGALVDLAADTRFAYGLDGQVVLDEHRPTPSTPPGATDPDGVRIIQQAIGLLIDRGHLPEDAPGILHDLADQDQLTLTAAAQRFVDTAANPATD